MDWAEIDTYMQQARKYRLLTPEEETVLTQTIKAGGPGAAAARDQFLNANLRLVVAVARKYCKSGVPFADIVQEGNLGLMRALDKFDPDRGCKFSTYASWWIRQTIARYLMQEDQIRVPIHMQEVRNRVFRATLMLEATGAATPQAVADLAGVTKKRLAQVQELPFIGASCDEPLCEDGSLLGDVIVDDDAEDVEAAVIRHDLWDHFDELLEGLTPRERLVFEMRFGHEGASLDQIGRALNLTRERIRQIIERRKPELRRRAEALGLR